MVSNNPFFDLNTASTYESWYLTTGKQAVIQEKLLIKTLLSYFPTAETILEVGCGTGYFTNWFKTMGLTPTGLDCSLNMLRVAQEKQPLTCVCGDAMSLPFSGQAFDLTTFITTLAFIRNPRQALRAASRVSKQGMILGVINKHSLLGWRYALRGGPIWDAAELLTISELINIVSEILPKKHQIIWRTTLLPLFKGSTKLPWGGFIGMAVKFNA